MTKTKYTVKYFINKFKAIPAKNWGVGQYSSGARSCALGHCGEGAKETRESIALKKFFESGEELTDINDGTSPFYQQRGPKARILAALKDRL